MKFVIQTVSNRQSNIELLRIFSMILIVSTHLLGHHIDMKGSIYPFPNGYVFYWIVKSITYIAVNMYVLISAYFLCLSKFKIKRVILLWMEVIFYSYVIGIPFSFSEDIYGGGHSLSIFFPLLLNEYWFATVFIGMLFLSPFINITLKAFNEKSLRFFCIVLIILFSIIPSFVGPFSRWLAYGGSCGILWFVVLYYIGAYIRLYVDINVLIRNKKRLLLIGLAFSMVAAFIRFVIVICTYIILGRAVGGGFFYGNNIIFNVIATVLIFCYFLTLNIKNVFISKWVCILAKSSFAVYLIHENPFISSILTTYVPRFVNTEHALFPFEFLIVLSLIWLFCTITDFIRQWLFFPINGIEFKRIDDKINEVLKL